MVIGLNYVSTNTYLEGIIIRTFYIIKFYTIHPNQEAQRIEDQSCPMHGTSIQHCNHQKINMQQYRLHE
jgi:hypothetical protein